MSFKNQSDFKNRSGCCGLWGRREGGGQHQQAGDGGAWSGVLAERTEPNACVGDPLEMEGKERAGGSDVGSKGDANPIS